MDERVVCLLGFLILIKSYISSTIPTWLLDKMLLAIYRNL